MSRVAKLPLHERHMLRKNMSSTESRVGMRQKHMAISRDRQMVRFMQNRPLMQAGLSHQEQRLNLRRRLGVKLPPKVTLNHTTDLSLNDRFRPHGMRNLRRQRHLASGRNRQRRLAHQQMMEIDNQPPLQSESDLIQQQHNLKQRLGKKSNIHQRLGRPLRGGTSMVGRGGEMLALSRGWGGRGGAAMKEALSTGGGPVARGALRRRRRQSGGAPVHGEGGRGVGARGGGDGGDDSRTGSDRRGGFPGRGGRRRRRGRGAERPPVTREQLDSQLDTYMSKTKSHLDAELDEYMAQKTG